MGHRWCDRAGPVQISPDELNDPDYINRIGNAISVLTRRI